MHTAYLYLLLIKSEYYVQDQFFPGIYYCIGKVLSFQRNMKFDDQPTQKDTYYFERGSSNNCSYSALEDWKIHQKPEVRYYYNYSVVCSFRVLY